MIYPSLRFYYSIVKNNIMDKKLNITWIISLHQSELLYPNPTCIHDILCNISLIYSCHKISTNHSEEMWQIRPIYIKPVVPLYFHILETYHISLNAVIYSHKFPQAFTNSYCFFVLPVPFHWLFKYFTIQTW